MGKLHSAACLSLYDPVVLGGCENIAAGFALGESKETHWYPSQVILLSLPLPNHFHTVSTPSSLLLPAPPSAVLTNLCQTSQKPLQVTVVNPTGCQCCPAHLGYQLLCLWISWKNHGSLCPPTNHLLPSWLLHTFLLQQTESHYGLLTHTLSDLIRKRGVLILSKANWFKCGFCPQKTQVNQRSENLKLID